MHSAINQYREAVLALWTSDHSSTMDGFDKWPLLSPAPECANIDVITLGLNPSYVLEGLAAYWQIVRGQHAHMPAWCPDALRWDRTESTTVRQQRRKWIASLDEHSRANYRPYYAPIEELVAAADMSQAWYHMDVFPLRATKARELTTHIPVPANERERQRYTAVPNSRLRNPYVWDDALNGLFDASIRLIKELQPKVVVVLNSYVSRLLHYRLSLTLQTNGHR